MLRCKACAKTSSVLSMECKFCRQKYCVLHRCPEDHACESYNEMIRKKKEDQTKTLIDQSTTLGKKISKI